MAALNCHVVKRALGLAETTRNAPLLAALAALLAALRQARSRPAPLRPAPARRRPVVIRVARALRCRGTFRKPSLYPSRATRVMISESFAESERRPATRLGWNDSDSVTRIE